ncbi:hypothetical protein I302_104364 [Kwoniella bestiolae CBS 10118]|uniref:RBR-type E3 ubiquitin transferase n=1 Tax=Kwoniella bestiolae CBS 10118 TaxID=1296100 RepID=A0A1B9GB31_9TREE|nr:hypothetical protein I302_03072 [Kwoniella bestiolae CBS 10118]OCF28220.1 hypothetical protein I302_03072 [Kwoniella bestiolae CBS 10118]
MSDDHLDEVAAQCASLQEDEITVLESIYPSLITVHPNPDDRPGRLLTLTLPITLPTSHQVQLDTSSGPSASLGLSHLPALTLKILFPPAYPTIESAKVISLRAPLPSGEKLGNWLPRTKLRQVQDKLQEMWEEEKKGFGEGVGVIWKWWEWVGNGDFLTDLGMFNGPALELSIPPMLTPSTFHTMLKTYNASQLHSDFEKTAFSCSICLENRKGKSCVQIPGCGCVFCTPCLSSCWSLAITEGSLENVSCPSVSCTKQRALRDRGEQLDSDVDAVLVESVVGRELRERWEDVKEKRKAEIDPLYTICPRPSCQAAVPPPPLSTFVSFDPSFTSKVIRLSDLSSSTSSSGTASSNDIPTPSIPTEDRWLRHRTCPKCSYSFCLYCNATWHGPHTPCAFPQTSFIVSEYLGYPEGSEGRRRMEVKRGKANLERMVRQYLEDEANKSWMESKTSPCSGCGVRVEKSHGCNHMTCGRCNAHFCYRCGASINPKDPYKHYNTPGRSCFQKLFDQEEIERFEREANGGGVVVGGGGDDDWREFRGIWEW